MEDEEFENGIWFGLNLTYNPETEINEIVIVDVTQKAGCGSKTKSNVMVLAESAVLENMDTGKVERQCRYFKAKVLEDHKADETNNTLKTAIEGEQTIVLTDQSTSHVDIADYVELHITEKSSEQTTKEILKWVHIAISNAKRGLWHLS